MKTVLLLIISGSCFLSYNTGAKKEQAVHALPADHAIQFQAEIQPIFQKNCSPCHFPGGTMHVKMPFDKAETIIQHKEGILKRMDKKEGKELIVQFLAQNDTAGKTATPDK